MCRLIEFYSWLAFLFISETKVNHFITSIYRNILRDKIFTLINLTNLTIGFTTFILLGMVVSYEFSYDKSNANYVRIYRVQSKQEDSYPTNFCTYGPTAFRYHLLADLLEVEKPLIMREVAGQITKNGFKKNVKYKHDHEI